MVSILWEIVKATACVILIVSLVKVAIEEWFIKPIKKRKFNKQVKQAANELIEELRKEKMEREEKPIYKKKPNKSNKKPTKKEDK